MTESQKKPEVCFLSRHRFTEQQKSLIRLWLGESVIFVETLTEKYKNIDELKKAIDDAHKRNQYPIVVLKGAWAIELAFAGYQFYLFDKHNLVRDASITSTRILHVSKDHERGVKILIEVDKNDPTKVLSRYLPFKHVA